MWFSLLKVRLSTWESRSGSVENFLGRNRTEAQSFINSRRWFLRRFSVLPEQGRWSKERAKRSDPKDGGIPLGDRLRGLRGPRPAGTSVPGRKKHACPHRTLRSSHQASEEHGDRSRRHNLRLCLGQFGKPAGSLAIMQHYRKRRTCRLLRHSTARLLFFSEAVSAKNAFGAHLPRSARQILVRIWAASST